MSITDSAAATCTDHAGIAVRRRPMLRSHRRHGASPMAPPVRLHRHPFRRAHRKGAHAG
ncbi:MAG: hypothetical protein JSR92_13975 [Proteobacteria bacterium]|nr:hypothetical protein [Pseudomonadota bacterium]